MAAFKKQEIKIRKFKLAPPPSELPVFGKVSPEECSFFGRTNYEAALERKMFVFGMKRPDRKRHMYLIGKSGVGKSKLLELLIRQDIAYGHGVGSLVVGRGSLSFQWPLVPTAAMHDTPFG